MALDPNIILQAGRVQTQIDNPMDIAAKAYSMRHLAAQAQLQEQQMADDQATRAAYAKNMQIGPDGKPTLNQQGVIADLAGQGRGMQAYAQQQQFGAQSLQQREQQMKTLKDQMEAAHTLSMSMQDPTSYQLARQKGIEMGLPNADKLPEQFDPNFVKDLQFKTQDLKTQFDQQFKEKQLGEKKEEFQQREKDRQVQREQMGNTKQNQALQQTQAILESARGNPAVAQAQKDLYAAKKFEGLVNLYGDPNKLNPAQVQMAATEVAKIASGGVPTHSELQGLQPSTIPSNLASLAEKVMNNPTSAEAGEFLKRMGDYVGALKKDAVGVIKEKYGRVIETRKGQLGQQHYNDLKAQYLEPLNEASKPAASAAPVLKTHEIEWAD